MTTLPAFLRWLARVLSAVFSNLCFQADVLKSAGQRGGPRLRHTEYGSTAV